MPIIHIKSLPFAKPLAMPAVISGIGHDVVEANHIPQEHVHVAWEYFRPGHFAKGDSAPDLQPEGPHSVLVDLLAPDFNSRDAIGAMLRTLAQSISGRAIIPRHKIFINHRQAFSGMVFDDGDVVAW